MMKTVSKNEIHELVNKIIENKNLKIILKFCCKKGNSLLHILINEEDIEGFKSIMCIIKEVNKTDKNLIQKIINMKNGNGDTAAHIAVRKSNNQNNIFSIMVEALISVGADLTISNNNKEVIVQTCDKPYNEEETKQQQYINNCIFDNNNIYLNMIDTLQSDDNESSDDLDNIQTINSPLNHQFPLKVDILVIDKKQYQNQDQYQNQYQNQNQNQDQDQDQDHIDFKQILKQQFEKQFEQKQEQQLQQKLRQNFLQQRHTLSGGGKSNSRNENDEITGKRKINNPYISNGGSKKSEKNHSDAIEKIRKLGYSEEESKDVKNFLYYEIKDNFPDLNNDERSEKFAEVLKTFAIMDIKKVRKELEKYRERNNKNAPPKKEHQKESKKEPKKEKKSSKRSSKKKSSKRSSK